MGEKTPQSRGNLGWISAGPVEGRLTQTSEPCTGIAAKRMLRRAPLLLAERRALDNGLADQHQVARMAAEDSLRQSIRVADPLFPEQGQGFVLVLQPEVEGRVAGQLGDKLGRFTIALEE